MTEVSRGSQEAFVEPTEQQLADLGSTFCGLIQQAVVYSRLTGKENDDGWDFGIEGYQALINRDGYTREPELTIFPMDEWVTDSSRSFLLMSSRNNGQEDGRLIDCYRISLLKNTQLLQSVSRATIGSGLAKELSDDREAAIKDFTEDGASPDLRQIINIAQETRKRNKNTFYTELDIQFGCGECDHREISELLELLQRSHPVAQELDEL
jgi:hypothetical protein